MRSTDPNCRFTAKGVSERCLHAMLCLFFVYGFAVAQVPVLKDADETNEHLHIIAFGDSNTAKRGNVRVYASQLSEMLDGVRVTNAGIGGHHTDHGRGRLQKDVLSRRPDVVIVMFGINDAAVDVWKKPPATKPRVSLKRFEANLRHIVDSCRRIEATPVLMTATPLRWSDRTRQLYGRPPYIPDEIEGFNTMLPPYIEATRRVAEEEQVFFVDNYAAFNKAGPEKLLLNDGMHLNDAGHRLVANSLLPLVRKALMKSKKASARNKTR